MLEKLTGPLKKAPKWAWYTAAGVGLGAGAIKLYKGRDVPEDEIEVVPGDELGGSTGSTIVSGSPTPTIIPPVIIPAQGDPMAGVGELQGLYMSGIQDLMGGFGALWGPVATTSLEVLARGNDAIIDLALAGGVPNGATPIVNPAPIAKAPTVSAPKPAPKTCSQLFSNYPKHNSAKGKPSQKSCYRDACKRNSRGQKREVHIYKNGTQTFLDKRC